MTAQVLKSRSSLPDGPLACSAFSARASAKEPWARPRVARGQRGLPESRPLLRDTCPSNLTRSVPSPGFNCSCPCPRPWICVRMVTFGTHACLRVILHRHWEEVAPTPRHPVHLWATPGGAAGARVLLAWHCPSHASGKLRETVPN